MEFQQFFSAVRDHLGDPPDEVISESTIIFQVLSAFDFYAAQLYNAGKGIVEFKVDKTPTTKESNVTETFAFGNVGYVRLKVGESDSQTAYEDVDICDSIEDLNYAETSGNRAVFFYGSNPMKMVLSWTPQTDDPPTLQLWGEKILFSDLALSDAVTDIPQLFHHLVVEFATQRSAIYLLKKPDLVMFAQNLRAEMEKSVTKREIIWRNYLAGPQDKRRAKQVETYSPGNDDFYSDYY